MGTNRLFTDAECEEIARRNDAGESPYRLADRYGCAYMTIVRAIKVGKGEWTAPPCGPTPKHRIIVNEGYAKVLIDVDDPMAVMAQKKIEQMRKPYVLEHRLVLARALGRPLQPHETVHHLNGDTCDNRLENLELRVGRHGKGSTEAHCATCSCFEHRVN